MPDNLIRRLIIVGGLVIIGSLSTQAYWLFKTYDFKDQEFDLTARKVLLKVAQRISTFNEAELPKMDIVQRTASNHYAVNINSGIDATILEDYLYQEMSNHSLKADFEYSVFDCTSNNLVYGNYCNLENPDIEIEPKGEHPTFNDLDYYFVVRFPSRESFVLNDMKTTILFSLVAITSVLFFLYLMWIVFRQKKVSELQKDFINNMTHEFKTPISSIKIASDFLTKSPAIASDDRLSKYANIITDQNNRLNNQVEKVLNIARLEQDSFKLKKEKINLNQRLDDIIKNEGVKLSSGEIVGEFEDKKISINADPLHFTNVISNILDNAVKYSKGEPSIIVKTKDHPSHTSISISDNGIGINKEQLKNIFNKFYRVSTGNKHDVKGFGLGLFYVKNICTSHGWIIDAQSEENKGTTFNIKIPKNKAA